MVWNTLHMQRALDAIEAIGGEAMRAEYLRQIAPTRLDGINLRGTIEFPISRYAHWLLPSATTSLDRPLRQQAG
ncbi:Tn3 family transposase [Cupriavidus necator]|uniref:Tn3 family transposase n=1 Tax=Cupriavidus necator TaxID=106590 RepID=UPI0039C277B1